MLSVVFKLHVAPCHFLVGMDLNWCAEVIAPSRKTQMVLKMEESQEVPSKNFKVWLCWSKLKSCCFSKTEKVRQVKTKARK